MTDARSARHRAEPVERERPGADAPTAHLFRRAAAEALGTAMLVAAVVGSGIAAANLSPGNTGLQLLENAFATAAALLAIILVIGPVSGAHLNPVVTLADRTFGGRTNLDVAVYVPAQIIGGCLGAIIANTMFSLPAVTASTHVRDGGPLWLGEVVATFGLVLVIFGLTRAGKHTAVPFAVAAYIAGAYWFTSSTSFANPAVTIGRTLTDTFSGIAPSSAPLFIVAQLVGGAIAVGAVFVLYPNPIGPLRRPPRFLTESARSASRSGSTEESHG